MPLPHPPPRLAHFAIGAALTSTTAAALLTVGAAKFLAPLMLVLAFRVWRSWDAERADLVFVPFAALYLIHALAPPTAPDAIGYHLGLAAEWHRDGLLARPQPPGFYDMLPHGVEALFAAAMPLAGLRAGALAHLLFLLATPPLMLALGRRWGFDARPAALIYFVSPVVGVTASSAYVDAASVYFALVTVWLLVEDQLPWAGLTAGFCYAVKLSAAPLVLAVLGYLAFRRCWRGIALGGAMMAPWLLYAWWFTGNPVAPMLAEWIPSPAYYTHTVAGWNEFVRSYGVPWGERFGEVTLGGARAQGLLGPVYVLAPPLVLLALRRRAGALLTAAAALASAAWLLNAGTRFLMPAAAFLALAIVSALPARGAWALAALQAVLCWPSVLDRLVAPNAWRLPPEVPWRAAIGAEPQAEYLKRVKPETEIAAMIDRHARAGERVLDLGEAPRGYVSTAWHFSYWQYTPATRAAEALALAAAAERLPRALRLERASWPRRRLRQLRIELTAAAPDPWTLQEIRLLRQGHPIFPSRAWELGASTNAWDVPHAFDRNETSAWRTTNGPRRAGEFIAIEGSLDVDGVELAVRADETPPALRITGRDERGGAVELAAATQHAAWALPRNLRREAVRYTRREGFHWILAYRQGGERVAMQRSLANEPGDWGLARVDQTASGVALLKVDDGR